MSASPAEIRAWRLYKDTTRNLIGIRYEEAETWAWAKLQSTLQALNKSAKKREMTHA